MTAKEARDHYLAFAASPEARWTGNSAASPPASRVWRRSAPMGASMGRASRRGRSAQAALVDRTAVNDGLEIILSADRAAALDPFDRVQLAHVIDTCRRSCSLSEAGRMLFAASLAKRASSNDADRLRKYLQRFDLSWQELCDRH